MYLEVSVDTLRLAPQGKAIPESDENSPSEQLTQNSAPPARSEVIYDDVPCENTMPSDAGQCLTVGVICNVM